MYNVPYRFLLGKISEKICKKSINFREAVPPKERHPNFSIFSNWRFLYKLLEGFHNSSSFLYSWIKSSVSSFVHSIDILKLKTQLKKNANTHKFGFGVPPKTFKNPRIPSSPNCKSLWCTALRANASEGEPNVKNHSVRLRFYVHTERIIRSSFGVRSLGEYAP